MRLLLYMLLALCLCAGAWVPHKANSRHTRTLAAPRPPPKLWWTGSAGYALPDDAATLSHVRWNGTAPVDSKGIVWDLTGTVPQVTVAPFGRAGAGPYSAANHYQTHLANDPLDVAQGAPRTVCIIFQPFDTADARLLSAASGDGTKGWEVYLVAGQAIMGLRPSGVASANTVTVRGLNIWCGGYTGSIAMSKLNLAATNSSALSDPGPATATASLLGVYGNGTSTPFNGIIYETLVSASVPTDAILTEIQAQFFGHLLLRTPGVALTVARNAAENVWDPVLGLLYPVPPNALGCDSTGACQVHGAGANEIPDSKLMTTGWAAIGTASFAANSASCPLGPDRITRMHLINVPAAATDGYYWGGAAGASFQSAWMARATGDPACTVSITDNVAPYKQIAVAAAPTRETDSGGTKTGIFFYRNTGDTCTRFCAWGPQVEIGALVAGPYHETTSVRLTWPATTASNANPLGAARRWCVGTRLTMPPYTAANQYLWQFGNLDNSAGLYFAGAAQINFDIYGADNLRRTVYKTGWVPPAGGLEVTYVSCSDQGEMSIWEMVAGGALTRVDSQRIDTGTGFGDFTDQLWFFSQAGNFPPNSSVRGLKVCPGESQPARCAP